MNTPTLSPQTVQALDLNPGDLNLLVIVSHSNLSPTERAVRAHRSLRGVAVPIDVLVKTRAEVERYRHVYASLECQILERSKVLYRREARVGQDLSVSELVLSLLPPQVHS